MEPIPPAAVGAMMPRVEILGEPAVDATRQDGEEIFFGSDGDEVHVVVHQAVSENGNLGARRLFAKEIERKRSRSTARSIPWKKVWARLPESHRKLRWRRCPFPPSQDFVVEFPAIV